MQQQQAEDDQRAADQRQVARAVLDLVGEGQPEDPDRDGADEDVEAEPRVVVLARLAVCQRPQARDDDPPQVVAEVQEDGGHRPQLRHRREGRAGVLPAREGGHDPQVRGAGDREELGEPLHDPEHDRLEGAHRAVQPMSMVTGTPVNGRPPGPSRNATTSATSSGSISRLTACGARMTSSRTVFLGHAVALGLVGELALHERRAHEARAHRGGEDAVLGALECERAHEAEHAVLGRHVAGLVRRGGQRVGRRDRDVAPVAALGEVRPRRSGRAGTGS